MIHVDTQIHGLPGIANKRTLQLIRCLARSAGAGFYPSTVSCFIPSRERVHIRLRLENDGNLLFFRWDMFPRSQEGMCVCFLPLASSIFVSRRFARFPISNGSKWHPIKETNHRIIEPNCFRKPLQSQYQKLTFCLYFWNSSKRKNIQY